MIKPNKEPYKCGVCGKKSNDEGQMVLTASGLVPTYVRPRAWIYALGTWLCIDCVNTKHDEIIRERIDSVVADIKYAIDESTDKLDIAIMALRKTLDEYVKRLNDIKAAGYGECVTVNIGKCVTSHTKVTR